MDSSGTYFISRRKIGELIAEQLISSIPADAVVLAISAGGFPIAQTLAHTLGIPCYSLLLKDVYLPGDERVMGVINGGGLFTRNHTISESEFDDLMQEFHGVIETAKQNALHEIHAMSADPMLDPHIFKDKTIVIVNDFANTGTTFRAAVDFLKPVHVDKLVLVSAIAKVNAVDVMHQLGDKLHIMHTTDKDFPPDHYFEDNSLE